MKLMKPRERRRFMQNPNLGVLAPIAGLMLEEARVLQHERDVLGLGPGMDLVRTEAGATEAGEKQHRFRLTHTRRTRTGGEKQSHVVFEMVGREPRITQIIDEKERVRGPR